MSEEYVEISRDHYIDMVFAKNIEDRKISLQKRMKTIRNLQQSIEETFDYAQELTDKGDIVEAKTHLTRMYELDLRKGWLNEGNKTRYENAIRQLESTLKPEGVIK
ncbi:MAG: hypothetical protein ABFQ65_00975 [Nanoarchaeota archaeon]